MSELKRKERHGYQECCRCRWRRAGKPDRVPVSLQGLQRQGLAAFRGLYRPREAQVRALEECLPPDARSHEDQSCRIRARSGGQPRAFRRADRGAQGAGREGGREHRPHHVLRRGVWRRRPGHRGDRRRAQAEDRALHRDAEAPSRAHHRLHELLHDAAEPVRRIHGPSRQVPRTALCQRDLEEQHGRGHGTSGHGPCRLRGRSPSSPARSA